MTTNIVYDESRPYFPVKADFNQVQGDLAEVNMTLGSNMESILRRTSITSADSIFYTRVYQLINSKQSDTPYTAVDPGVKTQRIILPQNRPVELNYDTNSPDSPFRLETGEYAVITTSADEQETTLHFSQDDYSMSIRFADGVIRLTKAQGKKAAKAIYYETGILTDGGPSFRRMIQLDQLRELLFGTSLSIGRSSSELYDRIKHIVFADIA